MSGKSGEAWELPYRELKWEILEEMFYRARDMGCVAGRAAAKHLWKPVYPSEDAREGPRTFAQRRKPVLKGR